MSHFIVKCYTCKKTISQCRCFSDKEEVSILCDQCELLVELDRGAWEDEKVEENKKQTNNGG